LCGCTNSIGSSIVMMCSERSLLILSIIAASVVDLPEPVGPVTRIQPLGAIGQLPHDRREIQLVEGANLEGDDRMAAATAPRSRYTLQRKRARFWIPKERSSSFSSSNFCFCASLSTL